MKIAILFLFAFVAVSQAAFSSSLVQRAQPILAKTFAQAHSHVRTRENGLETALFQTISEQANDLLEQIQAGIENGVALAESVSNSITGAVVQLQALGNEAVEAAVSIIGNLWGSLFGNKRSTRLDIDTISSLLTQLGLDNLLGGLFQYVVNLIDSLAFPQLIQSALNAILSSDIVSTIMSALYGERRSLFGDLVNGLSGAVGSIATQMSGFINQLQDSVASGLASVLQLAQDTLAEAMSQGTQLVAEAAENLLAALAPYAPALGALYTQIVGQIQQLTGRTY